MPASKLMKAKQTLSFTTGLNNPGSWEFVVLTDFIKKNLNLDALGDNLFLYCRSLAEIFELETVLFPHYTVTRDESGRQGRDPVVIWNEMSHQKFESLLPSINTMLKTGERGKMKRRMIATTSMLVRPFVYVAE